jgi:hypothetical protein
MQKQTTMYTVEVETIKGKRERVWPEGGSEATLSEREARDRIATFVDMGRINGNVEGISARCIRGFHLVCLTFEGVREVKADTVAGSFVSMRETSAA